MSRIYTVAVGDEVKKIDMDNLEYIYGDGRHGSKPVYLWKYSEDKYVFERVNLYQGEESYIKFWTQEKAIEWLKEQTQHPKRQICALEEIGYEVKDY